MYKERPAMGCDAPRTLKIAAKWSISSHHVAGPYGYIHQSWAKLWVHTSVMGHTMGTYISHGPHYGYIHQPWDTLWVHTSIMGQTMGTYISHGPHYGYIHQSWAKLWVHTSAMSCCHYPSKRMFSNLVLPRHTS